MELTIDTSVERLELATDYGIVLHAQHVDIVSQTGTCTQVHLGSIVRPPGQLCSISQFEPSILGRSQEVGIHITTLRAEAVICIAMVGNSGRRCCIGILNVTERSSVTTETACGISIHLLMTTCNEGIGSIISTQSLEETLTAILVVVQLECQGTALHFTIIIHGHHFVILGSTAVGCTPAVGGSEHARTT